MELHVKNVYRNHRIKLHLIKVYGYLRACTVTNLYFAKGNVMKGKNIPSVSKRSPLVRSTAMFLRRAQLVDEKAKEASGLIIQSLK